MTRPTGSDRPGGPRRGGDDGVVSVRQCPGGPLLVRGADRVLDPDGVEHAAERPVVAVCVCGRSQRQPWCDGTHRYLRRD